MSTTFRKLAEEALRIYNGGKIRVSNNEYDIRMVALIVSQERDFVVKDKIASDIYALGPVEDSMFTRYENVVPLYDTATNVWYDDLPMGYLSLPHDKGLRYKPMDTMTRNTFRRLPSGVIGTSKYVWIEGNIGWEVRPPVVGGNRRVIFSVPMNDTSIVREVVIGDSEGDLNGNVGVPDGLVSVVLSRVLSKMGYRPMPADKVNDNRDVTLQQ